MTRDVPEPPTGAITFLFTDIEGSTKLWEEHPDEMAAAVETHDLLLRQAIEGSTGFVFKTVGDAFCAAFASPLEAVSAAVLAQRALAAEHWSTPAPIRVRMGLHTGEALQRDDDYFGQSVNRCARVMSAGHGGQVLLSSDSCALVRGDLAEGLSVVDKGRHRLKDLTETQRLYQLVISGLPHEFAPLRTLKSIPNNLPVRHTSFVGRHQEHADVAKLLRSSQLVTITGPGGAGKSRLALQVAGELSDSYEDGTWLVELAPLSAGSDVLAPVADVLDIAEEPGISLLETLCDELSDKRILLILDNCEHVLEGCAELAQALLGGGALLTILGTSREALEVPGEKPLRLRSLPVPDAKEHVTAEAAWRNDSVQLFADRASDAVHGFTVTDENVSAIAEICALLEGIPLAIELAAARTSILAPQQILERIADRFSLLAGHERRAAVPHHVTLTAAIDWSWALLDETEDAVMRRLSVFRGGWFMDAAEEVCSGSGIEQIQVLDVMQRLERKSLVAMEPLGDTARYDMLESIRKFASDKLAASDDGLAVGRRHLIWARGVGEEAASDIDGPDQSACLERLALEHPNLLAALDWAGSREDASTDVLGLAGALSRFWLIRGLYTEGRRVLDQVLAIPSPPTEERSGALEGASALAIEQGDYAAATGMLEASLAIRQESGDLKAAADVLRMLGTASMELGQYEQAESRYQQALAHYDSLGDKWGMAASLNNLGLLARRVGDMETARRHLEDSLDRFRALDNDWAVAITLLNLADLYYDLDDDDSAARRYDGALQAARTIEAPDIEAYALVGLAGVARRQGRPSDSKPSLSSAIGLLVELGDLRSLAECLEECAVLAADEGHASHAARLYSAAERLRREIDAPMVAEAEETHIPRQAQLRDALGEDGFEIAWQAGADFSWEEAAAEAREQLG